MRIKTALLAGATAAGLMVAAPAFAQTTGGPSTIADHSDGNILVNDLLDVFAVDNAADSYSWTASFADNSQTNGNSSNVVIAEQSLKATNINKELDEVVDLDGLDDPSSAVGYHSGSQSVNDNAFAAFAGISNAAWNSGINANTQAATNIAAQGTINFGVSGSNGGGTGGGGNPD